MVKIEKIEHPDIVIKAECYTDKLQIYVRKNKVEFKVDIDGAGNIFVIDRKVLRRVLKWPQTKQMNVNGVGWIIQK